MTNRNPTTRLAQARKAAGLTQEQLAKELGIDQSALCRIEQGDKMPTLPVAAKLVQLLGVSLEDFSAVDPLWQKAMHYTYRVRWCRSDRQFVATCAQVPHLSFMHGDQIMALRGARSMVCDELRGIATEGRNQPKRMRS